MEMDLKTVAAGKKIKLIQFRSETTPGPDLVCGFVSFFFFFFTLAKLLRPLSVFIMLHFCPILLL